jgi:hypothetical protein
MSHSKQRSGGTNQDMVFLLPSEQRKPTTICHCHARAYLNTEKWIKLGNDQSWFKCHWQDRAYLWTMASSAPSGQVPKWDVSHPEWTPVIFLSFWSIGTSRGCRPIAAPTESLHPSGVTVESIDGHRWEDQESWRRPTTSPWSRHMKGGACGFLDATSRQVLSTWRSPSSVDRWWWGEQVTGTPHIVWTVCTTHPTSRGYACGSWAETVTVEYNNSTKILAQTARTYSRNQENKKGQLSTLTHPYSAIRRPRCLLSQKDSSKGNWGCLPAILLFTNK